MIGKKLTMRPMLNNSEFIHIASSVTLQHGFVLIRNMNSENKTLEKFKNLVLKMKGIPGTREAWRTIPINKLNTFWLIYQTY